MSSSPSHPARIRKRAPWDMYRKIAAWAGLIEFAAVIVIIYTVGDQLRGGPQAPATTWLIVLILCSPPILAGLVSGSRYFALYRDYSQRLDPREELSDEDAASGSTAANSIIGDVVWGSLIAGIAGTLPAIAGLSTMFGPMSVLLAIFLVPTIGIAWCTGWAIGVTFSLIFSTSLGIIIGASKRPDPGKRVMYMMIAVFLPALLIGVSIAIAGTRYPEGAEDAWNSLMLVAGLPVTHGEFFFGDTLLWVARISIWVTALLFLMLVTIAIPALLKRIEARATG